MDLVLTVPLSILSSVVAFLLPGFTHWMKWLISYICLYTCTKNTKSRFDVYDKKALNQPYKLGFLIPPEEAELECPQDESHLQQAADEVLCYGVNSKSECLVVRVARGCNQESEAWVYLKLSNGKAYRLPEVSSHHQQPFNDKCTNFSCGGLQMYYLAPLRRWRIFYNGLLNEISKENPEMQKIVHVKFSFIWRASSNVFDLRSDMNIALTAEALSDTPWKGLSPPVKQLQKIMDHYSQSGVFIGTVKVGDDEERDTYLWGSRMRFLGDTTDIEGATFLHILGNTENGSAFHLGKSSVPNLVQNLHFGHVMHSSSALYALEKCEIISKESPQGSEEDARDYYAKFTAGRDFELDVDFLETASSFKSNKGWGGSLVFNIVKLKLDKFQGSGIVIVGTAHETPKRPQLEILAPSVPKVPPLVIEFENRICQIPDLTGGKGSSLAKLTEISRDVNTFEVPKGVVVTAAAYQEFLDCEVEEAIKQLEDIAYGQAEGDLKDACGKVSKSLIAKKMPENLCHEIEKSLRHMFAEETEKIRFAVRSSATGEDTEQMSAAGQMDTYLGVKGLEKILESVKKSWASQFGFIAVEYKRRNGQLFNSPMAVVIQEMVPCDVAGVMFTCDPVTGNPGIISITANYGLGESVVSGSTEADTLILNRDIQNQLTVISTTIGDKRSKVVMDGSGGTIEEALDETKRKECSLSEEMALNLANIGLTLEESYRSTRDIEWGILKGKVFLLQSRPVTSGTAETDFEIRREFDSALRREDEYLSVHNVGEVMPGATSPLGMDIIIKFFAIAFQSRSAFNNTVSRKFETKYFAQGIVPINDHLMFNLIDAFFRFQPTKANKTSAMTQAAMVSLFGRVVDDKEILDIARERSITFGMKTGFMLYVTILVLFFSSGYLRKIHKKYKDYRIRAEKYSTAKDLFQELVSRCSDLSEMMESHMRCTQKSSMWNMFILSSLANNKGGFEADVYRDFAFLMSTCNNVESAEVPAAMQSLAYAISQDIDPSGFKAMNTGDALTWLRNTTTSAGTKFQDFLSRHGHRCLKEFDIHSITWGMDPRPLIKLLQGMVGNVKDISDKKELNINEVMSNLAVPLKFKYRMIVKFLLPYSRQAVRERESSKSLLIMGLDKWRRGYHRLAELMFMEGRIPDKDLLFFFTLEEIDELLKTRSPKLISKANHRRKLFPEMDRYIFPEIMQGYASPINLEKYPEEPSKGEFVMKGVPVSQGVVRAPARVAMTLEEADSLKAGEVLITYSTDIGWSPYFPILAGVVTELGGLISHGAVVAREYGLPCVVGLHGATRQFKTGDYVLLDGNKGILKRLVEEQTS